MTDKDSISALQRKLASAGSETTAKGRSILRALRIAMARAAADVFDLELSVIGATQAWRGQGDLTRHLDEARLLILLDGPEGMTGALSLDRTVVAALIQQQTTGNVLGNSPGARPYTCTDAALAAPLIDAMLSGAYELCDRQDDRDCLSGFRFGARSDHLQSLLLALDGDRFRAFDLTLDFGGGKTQGAISLILPEPLQPADLADSGEAEAGLGTIFGAVRAELIASIGHIRLPLSELADMKAGDILPLQGRNLRGVEIWSITGERVANGRLGQVRGLRAVRLTDGTLPDPGADSFADRAPVRDAARPSNKVERLRKTATVAEISLPATPDESYALTEGMTTDQVAAEITQLAGLSPDDTAEPEVEEHN